MAKKPVITNNIRRLRFDADEMTQAQAADVLGISEGTVAWRLSEIRKRLTALHEGEQL